MIMLAGCSDNSGGSDSGSDSTQKKSEGPVDVEFITFERHWMDSVELNPFSTSIASGLAWTLNPSLARYSSTASFNGEKEVEYNEFYPMAAKEWALEDGSFTITLRDDWNWSSGDPVTSEDLALRLKLSKYFDHPIWDFLSSVSTVDEKTVSLELAQKTNQEMLEHTLFGATMRVDTPATVNGEQTKFAKTLEALQDASSEKERDGHVQELVNYKWRPNGEAVLNGPFTVSKATKDTLLLERHDGFYNPVNFTKAQIKALGIGSLSTPSQAVMSNNIDMSSLPKPEQTPSFAEDLNYSVRRGTIGVGFGMNYEDPGGGILTNRNVRRAVAYLLSSENASQNSNPLKAGTAKHPTSNLPNATAWIPDTVGKLDQYEPDTEKARKLLEGEGLTKESGTWMKPNGDKLVIPVNTAPWHIYPGIGQTVVQALEEFGIKTSLNSKGSDQFVGMMWGSQDFIGSLGTWGAAHPYNAFKGVFGKSNVWNTPAELEVPKPIGDPDGSLETVNVREKTSELKTLSGDEFTQNVRELAWAFNQTLPIIPLVTENGGVSYWDDDWKYPNRDNPVWGGEYPKSGLFAQGLINTNR